MNYSRRKFLNLAWKSLPVITLMGTGISQYLEDSSNQKCIPTSGQYIEREDFTPAPIKENSEKIKIGNYSDSPKEIKLIDSRKPVELDKLILPNGYFTWRHALTKNGFIRILKHGEVVEGIYKGAELLESEVNYLNVDPTDMNITSWYRTPEENRKIGGAKYSKHLEGIAIDHSIKGMPMRELYKRLDSFLTEFTNGFGGLKRYKEFIHMDCRTNFKWRS